MTDPWTCDMCGAGAQVQPTVCPECLHFNTYRPSTRIRVFQAAEQRATLRELYGRSERTLVVPTRWKAFLGDMSEKDGWLGLWWGPPGSLKSTCLLLLLAEVAGRGVFVSIEEGLSDSLRSKVRRLELATDQVIVTTGVTIQAATELADEIGTPWICWDSLSMSALLPEDLEGLRREGYKVALACHATKGGGAAGPLGVQHVVDHVARFEDGVATVEKNRYGQAGVAFRVTEVENGEVESSVDRW